MLQKDDFDFYYLIICSRGPGSETITVDKITKTRSVSFVEEAEEQFKKFGVCEAEADFNDEGLILAMPAGTKPLKAIYAWLKQDAAKLEEEYPSARPDGVLPSIPPFDYGPAYVSACIRVFLPSEIGEDGNPWTSVNGWRKVDIEIPNKAQFEALMEATGETAEQLGKWDCTVLRAAAKRYLEGKLPEREFPGC